VLHVGLSTCEDAHGIKHRIASDASLAAALLLLHLLLELIFVLLVALGEVGFGTAVRVGCLLALKLLDPVQCVEDLVLAFELLEGFDLCR
jgi:hypothetical protein